MPTSDNDKLVKAIQGVGSDFYNGLTNEEAAVSVRCGDLRTIADGVEALSNQVDGVQYQLNHHRRSLDSRLEDVADALNEHNALLKSIATSLVTIAKSMEGK